jgi:hypothetical protein
MAAQGKLVDPVEEDREAVGGPDRREERIEPGLDREVAQ